VIDPSPPAGQDGHVKQKSIKLLLRVLLGLLVIWLLASALGRFQVVETRRESIGDYDAFEGLQEYEVTHALNFSWGGEIYELRRWTQKEKHSPFGD
jgi:hypothetical protein